MITAPSTKTPFVSGANGITETSNSLASPNDKPAVNKLLYTITPPTVAQINTTYSSSNNLERLLVG